MSFQHSTYESKFSLDDDRDNDSLLEMSTPPPYSQEPAFNTRQRLWRSQVIIVVHAILLLISLITFCGMFFVSQQEAEATCIRKTSTYCTSKPSPTKQNRANHSYSSNL